MLLRRFRPRYIGTCAACGSPVAHGVRARWDAEAGRLLCEACHAPTPDDELTATAAAGTVRPPAAGGTGGPTSIGTAGASAQRQFEQRAAARRREVHATHPRLGGLLSWLAGDPQHIRAWAEGAAGERAVGRLLDGLRHDGVHVLHDRLVHRGGRANIDHLVVTASAVWVVDTKAYHGLVARRGVGGWFRTGNRLFVAGRDRTALVAGAARQADAVRAVLSEERADVPVHAVLCFVGAEWGWPARPFQLDGVLVTWPSAFAALLWDARSPGPRLPARTSSGPTTVDSGRLAARLAAALPPAR